MNYSTLAMGMKKSGRLKYKPVNVKEIIAEIRNTAELMLDLAYSSILFKEKHFGEEVIELEKKIDEMIFMGRVSVMLAARGIEEVQNLASVLQIIDSSAHISYGAVDLAKINVSDIGIPSAFLHTFHLIEETLTSLIVPEKSKAVKISVQKIENVTGMRIIAIKTSTGKWTINPVGDVIIYTNDRLIAKGPFEALEEFEIFCTGKHEAFPSLNELNEPKILRHIRETLTEMMMLSLLSIDLAYSSVIFNTKGIAEEVAAIEDKLEILRSELEDHILRYAKIVENVLELRGLLRIASASEKISDASKDIADILLSGVGLHPILLYAIKESDEVITRIEIEEDSQLDGKSIGELDIEVETGMNIIALKKPKAGKWQFYPKGDHTLEAADIIIAKGLKEGDNKLRKLATGKDM